jgi:hypothetical protein
MADVSGLASKKVEGVAAQDEAVDGNPVLVGAQARTAFANGVSAADDAMRLSCDVYGRLLVNPYQNRASISSKRVALTTTTPTILINNQASRRRHLIFLVLSNSAATSTSVVIERGTTDVFEISLPAGTTRVVPITPTPSEAGVNVAWNVFQRSPAVSTVYITALALESHGD